VFTAGGVVLGERDIVPWAPPGALEERQPSRLVSGYSHCDHEFSGQCITVEAVGVTDLLCCKGEYLAGSSTTGLGLELEAGVNGTAVPVCEMVVDTNNAVGDPETGVKVSVLVGDVGWDSAESIRRTESTDVWLGPGEPISSSDAGERGVKYSMSDGVAVGAYQ
jgi:hypothetical protein